MFFEEKTHKDGSVIQRVTCVATFLHLQFLAIVIFQVTDPTALDDPFPSPKPVYNLTELFNRA